jgi:hypothetical protein
MLSSAVLLKAGLLSNSWHVFQSFFPVTSRVYNGRDRFCFNIHTLFISMNFNSFFRSFLKTIVLLSETVVGMFKALDLV